LWGKRRVCWCETESAQAINHSRAATWGLPLDRIVTPFDDPLTDVLLTDPLHMAALRAKAEDPEVGLLIVDSLSGGHRIEENSSAMGRVVQGIAEIARDTGKPVLVSHHIRKHREYDPDARFGISIDQIRGHSSIVQSPRVIWGLDRPGGPETSALRLHQVKNNLRAYPEWIGMEVDGDGFVTFGDAPEPFEAMSACAEAVDWLAQLLSQGALPAFQVLEEAKKAKIASATLYRAKKRLSITSPKKGASWFWELPSVKVKP
jgi:hypothetical protein